jgi:hypothetical protein
MSAWTWVLTGLCVAGVLLALGSIVPVAIGALRVKKKIDAIKQRPLFLSIDSMRVQSSHLSHSAAEMRPLAQRAQTAIASIRESARESGIAESRTALEHTGAELHELYEDLR